ncbi:hypothetical protein G6F56_007734 [Rhizopus delemar]|uniref:Major facilitator superfamily (MFS) profile domain-containing protein n=1 Tax=Rhizopus stolonifer TaxID=4846 RepID=A0A367KIR6_RHIST|nr:hypothetical protein G6F56_007734 [Rhizopus delemar]RCI02125.1 hypothetical protein CU098_001095 [Rhizopus stolonifer]
MVSERSPLLKNQFKQPTIEDEREGSITVVTSDDDLPKSPNSDEILIRRLNGSPLWVVLWVGVGLSSLDASIVATIYPQIGTEFKRSNEIVWIATAYMLSYTALQPLYGRISDVFGRKNSMLFATIVFFIGSAMCGASTSLWTLVISRGIAGIGGGGMNTLSAVITSDLVSLRERGKYQGYANIAYGLGSVIGAPLGGIITDSVGWRYCFYINLPLLIISLYVAGYLLTNYNLEEQDDGSTLLGRFKKIDYMGASTLISAVVCFLLATSMGGNSRSWSDPLVYGLLLASVSLSVAFCAIEKYVALNPIMPWSIISSRTPLACSLTNFFGIMCSFAMTYTTPLFFQGVLGYSSSQAGLFFLPKVASMSCGSLSSGFWMARTGEYRAFLLCTSLIACLAMIGSSLWTKDTPLPYIVACLMMDGFSSGAIVTTALVAMLSCVGSTEMATITSVSYLFRSSGGVIGISATSAIFQGLVKKVLTERIKGPDAEQIIEIARKSMTEVRELLPSDALIIVLDTYQVAIRYSFYFCIVVSALGFFSTLFIQQFSLHSRIK